MQATDGKNYMNRTIIPSRWIRSVYKETGLVADFFGLFARLEYALKATPRYLAGDDNKATANWDRFADDLKGKLSKADSEFESAASRLLSQPPQKQVVKNRRLTWAEVGRNGAAKEKFLLQLIRVVRNNLFHGGKFPEGSFTDPARDRALIQDCIVILEAALHQVAEVEERFYETA